MDNHIINLLKTNNRVIIPEFGAFIVKSGSPRTIVFNEFLKYNDEVLLKEICSAENIAEDEATKKLDEFTRELNSQLDLGQNHKVGDLGTLSKDNNGRVHFQMSDASDLQESSAEPKIEEKPVNEKQEAPVSVKKETLITKPVEDSFEINKEKKVPEETAPANKKSEEEKPLKDEPLKKAEEKKESAQGLIIKKDEPKKDDVKKENEPEKKSTSVVGEKKKQPLTVNEKLQANIKKPEKETVTPKKEEDKKEDKAAFVTYLNNNKNTVWYAILAVVVVAIVIWFINANKEYLFDSSNSKKATKGDEIVIQPKDTQKTEEEKASLSDENVDATKSEVEESKSTEEKIIEPAKESEKTETAIVKSQSDAKRYYIVAGCFQQETNADKYVNYLNGQGYNSEKFGKYGGLFAVSFDSFNSFSDAQKELNKIKKDTEPEAWILYY